VSRAALLASVLLLSIFSANEAEAWIFPEHRDIGRAAIAGLDENSISRLTEIWKAANTGHSPRLCGKPSEQDEVPTVGETPCADLAMLGAMGGDHSCSPEDMENIVLNSSWFPRVARFSATLKHDLMTDNLERKLDAWSESNVTLLRYDHELISRAINNNAHFPLAAAPVAQHETMDKFLDRSCQAAAPMNAIGVYSRFHLAALQYARLGMTREAVMSEGFADHFLEDVFSAGHFAGTWGIPAVRKGTHDYYCENGLVSQTWGGQRYSGHGDAFSTPEDFQHTSAAVRESLRQFIDAFSSHGNKANPEAFSRDICRTKGFADPLPLSPDERAKLDMVLNQTPIPDEGEDGVSVPRYRSEVGPFVSVSMGGRFGGATSGFSEGGDSLYGTKRFEGLLRLGYGTEGILSNRSDGTMFVEFGFVGESDRYTNPRLDNRGGERFGLRTPFWILPGDMLLLVPILYFTGNTQALQNVAISASNGGILGLERRVGVPFGTLQLMVGRQIAISLFGYLWNDAPLITNAVGTTIGSYRSMEFDFPVIEYRIGHTFATKLAFNTTLQFGYALDVPNSVQFNSDVTNPPSMHNSSIVYLRLSLEAAKY
jgi:hypothetical protein